ncbi:Protein sidekick-2 [Pteropus alecto]|uniref:Protein sidekick-2 n=1 Tax=Pteropus alecto TaxID=9402 RepID=L5KM92_PTEAL|nr:Protein sidekick-2 [Pteropus alecto]
MISSLDRTHAGSYRCIVRNRMGALLQRQTEVQVAREYKGGSGQGVRGEGEGLQGPCPPAMLLLHSRGACRFGPVSPILPLLEPRSWELSRPHG